MSYREDTDHVVDYSNELEGTFFGAYEQLQGCGRIARGLFQNSNPTNENYGQMWDAVLSQRCEHSRDQAFICVQCDERISLTKEEYMTFLTEGVFTDSMYVFA